MLKPDLIVRTNRRSISISLSKNGEVIVRAPKKLRMENILSFIKEKEGWIRNKKKQIELANIENYSIKNGKQYLFCGKTYTPQRINGLKNIEISNSSILYPATWENDVFISKMYKWYRGGAEIILKERLEFFSEIMQLQPSNFSVKNFKGRWGSCDLKNNIKINFRVIMLPHKLIDYIIIHELAHMIEFNHSKQFYSIIESLMPDWKIHRKKLREYNYLLDLF